MSRKLMVLALLAVLALGTLGAAYTYWSEGAVIGGLVSTGTFDIDVVEPTKTETNANGVSTCTIVSATDALISLNMANMVPGYGCTINFKIDNTGTIPAKITTAFVELPAALAPYGSFYCPASTLAPADEPKACSVTFALPANLQTGGDWDVYDDGSDTTGDGEGISGSITLNVTGTQWNVQ